MSAHKKQLKNQHGESETVVIRGALQIAQTVSLQFRRRVRGNADFAQIRFFGGVQMITVAVNQSDCCVARDHDVAVIHIADHVIMLMNNRERARQIRRRVQQKSPIGFGKITAAAARIVKLVNRRC